MPRRHVVTRREAPPDPVHGSALVNRFVNALMSDGKKSTAQQVFYGALNEIQRRTQDDPVKTFRKAVDSVKPMVEVKSRRVGGSTYQIPVDVNQNRRTSLAVRWLINYATARPEKGMVAKLASEFIDAANGRGNSVKKREDTHRMAEANKAFSHYRW